MDYRHANSTVITQRYKVYGLVIESELVFPHWPSVHEHESSLEADVVIKLGDIPRDWSERTPSESWYLVEQNHAFMRIQNVGRFLISHGNSILYDPCGQCPDDAWLYVEGAITGALLHQRHIWPLHGCTVLKPDGFVAAFVGQRGIGKSTLLFELHQRGLRVVADDIAAITFDSEPYPLVHPGFPQGKLCMDAVESFGLDASQLRPLQNLVQDKFAVKYEREFVSTPCRLNEVYVLERHEGQGLECREFSGLEKLRQLSDNTYRLELLSATDDYERLFKNILRPPITCARFGSPGRR